MRVGFILPLTGAFSEFGEAQRNALEFAREMRPELFSKIRFIYEDNGLDGPRTISAFNKLKNLDSVDAIFVFGVEPSLILAPIAEASHMPLIVSAQAAPASIGRKYVVRSINYSAQYSRKLLEYFRSKDIHRIAVLQAEMSFYNLLIEGLRSELKDGESLEVIDNYSPSATDLRSSVTKLRNKSFDILGLYLTPRQIIEATSLLSNQHITTHIFGATPFQSATLVKQTGESLIGSVYAHNVVTEDFRTRYNERFHNDSQLSWAANAYDVAILLGEQFGSIQNRLSSGEILSKLCFSGKRSGAGGEYEFRDDARGGKFFDYAIGIFEVQEGNHRVVFH